MKSTFLAALFCFISLVSFASEALASDQIQVSDYETGVGLGCYGRCGYLSVTFKVQNIAYHKRVGVLYRDNGGEWREVEAYYVRPLENGYEEWKIATNFSERGQSIEFVAKYEVEGEVYWDNNNERNFTGTFL